MSKGPVPAATVLRPLLDTYLDSAVALVGCRAKGIERYSCEFDVLVVTEYKRPPASLKVGEGFADIFFTSETEVLKPSNPELALSLALAKPVRDTSLVLSTSSAANLATLSESSKKASETRLASALKILGRAEAAFAKKGTMDADFWLLAATYEYAYALLLASEVLPSPSHMLSQLRGVATGRSRGFEGVSLGTGLEGASRAGCGARLEGVSILHDLLREGAAGGGWPKVRTEALAAKAQELVTRTELAECYSYLGQELVDGIMHLVRKGRSLSSLTSGDGRLLGERLTRQLGLARDDKAIGDGLAVMKERISSLARSG